MDDLPTTVTRTVTLTLDDAQAAAVEAALARGEAATLDALVAIALDAYLDDGFDAPSDPPPTFSDAFVAEVRRRGARPLSEALTAEKARERLEQLLNDLG